MPQRWPAMKKSGLIDGGQHSTWDLRLAASCMKKVRVTHPPLTLLSTGLRQRRAHTLPLL